jgi:ribose 1,5-bisphosphokinase
VSSRPKPTEPTAPTEPASGRQADAAAPIGPGRVILIVGPSGSGKDTLLRLASAAHQSNPVIRFPARVVTRTSTASEEIELSQSAFAAAKSRGEFCLTWSAHNLEYGIPVAIDEQVRAGSTVVLNASRTVVSDARARYANVAVVLIDAPADVRAARLAARGREASDDVAERLARSPPSFQAADADLVIVNTAGPQAGADRLARFIAGRRNHDEGIQD